MGNKFLVGCPRKLYGTGGFRRGCILALSIFLSAMIVPSAVAIQKYIEIKPPENPGKYIISGTVFFNPGELSSPDSIRVLVVPEQSATDLAILFVEEWPEGSGLMSVDIAFAATDDEIRSNRYVLELGCDRRERSVELDRSLPELSFEIGDEVTEDNLSVPVGTLVVKVRRYPEFYYYWYLIPILAIIGLLIWRKIYAR